SMAVLVMLFGVGLGQGALWATSATMVSLFSPASRQGTAFGILTSAQALANGSGPLIGGLVASAFDFHAPFAVISGSLLVAALLGITLPSPPAAVSEVAVA